MARVEDSPIAKPLPLGLKTFLWTSVGASLLALLMSLLRSVTEGRPFGSDGLWVSDYGFDYFDYYPRFLYRHSVMFFTCPGYPWYYPAPAIFFHYPFYVLAHRTGDLKASYGVYVGVIAVAAIALAIGLGRALRAAGLRRSQAILFSVLTLLTSWSMYFAAQRGNIEGLTWMLVGGAVWAYAVRRNGAAAVLIGLAASVKIYPLLFGVLFLRQRRWWALVVVLLTAALVTIVGLRFLEPPLHDALRREIVGIRQWTVAYGEVYRDPEWDHSLFGLVKDIGHTKIRSYHRALILYYLVAGSIASLLFLLRVRRLATVNQVLFLSCAAVTLPPTSFDYTLCLMYVPFAWLALEVVRSDVERLRIKGLASTMGLLGVALAPTTFLFSPQQPALPGACRAVCLLALMGMAAAFPFEQGLGLA